VKHFWDLTSEQWTVIATVVNAAATVVVAIFTTVLGVFTIKLARSTRVAAQAAKDSAEALMAAEGAHLRPVVIVDSLRQTFGGVTLYDKSADETPIFQTPTVSYNLKNHGKSPAILVRMMHCIVSTAKIREMVQVERPIEIIAVDKEIGPFECELLGETLNYGKARAILDNSETLLFCGEAVFRDFFGRSFQCIWEYRGDNQGFHLTRYEERPI
jgi:hypothetical protein